MRYTRVEYSNKTHNNLPAQTTEFIGREQDLQAVAQLLSDPTVRQVTLLAPGGMGKTRLALAVAQQQLSHYADGCYFLSLAALESVDAIVPAIAAAVKLSFKMGVDPLVQLLDHLRSRKTLLVLDNYEHLLAGAPIVTAILEAAPHLSIIVTSRERLHLSGETVYVLHGLELPTHETQNGMQQYSAPRLFIQCATRLRSNRDMTDTDLNAVYRICHLVQGMPLALVLAATWVNVLSLSDIADEIAENLDFLHADLSDLPSRLHSIRAVFEGTWKRLSDEQRQTFLRLSIFRGGCTREAIKQIVQADVDVLQSLIDKALIIYSVAGRYEIHELLRQYGEFRLSENPDEYAQVRSAHSNYYAAFTAQKYQELHTSSTHEWLSLMDTELDNLVFGWDWAIRTNNRSALWQYSKLYLFYSLRGRYEEGEAMIARSVAVVESHTNDNQPDILLARLLAFHVFLCHYTLKIDKLEASYHKGIAILRQIDDLGKDREHVAILYFLGSSLHLIAPDEAKRLLDECIAYCRQHNHRDALMVAALMNRLSLEISLADYATDINEGLEHARQINYLRGMAAFTRYRGMVAYWEEQNTTAAMDWLAQSVDLHQRCDDPLNLAGTLVTIADVAIDSGKYMQAKPALIEALYLFDDNGCLPWMLAPTLVCVARLLTLLADMSAAAEICDCVQHASFLNHPHIHPVNLVHDPDPHSLWLLLESELAQSALIAAAECGRALDMTGAIRRALHFLERIDIEDPIESTINDIDLINGQLQDPLTPREFEVYQHILNGCSNHEIAASLVISKNTLKTHISRLYHKLAVNNRAQAILRGQELGLLND